MNIIFSEEDSTVHHRSRYLRGGLLKNYHRVYLFRNNLTMPPADLWFHGLSHHHDSPFPDAVRRSLEQFQGKILLFLNDDTLVFPFEKIPQSIREKTHLFLRNGWPSDNTAVHPAIRGKTGLINPLLKPLAAKSGAPLKNRSGATIFYGASTGGKQHNRVDALRMVKSANVPLLGGLIAHPDAPEPPTDLLVNPLSGNSHMDALAQTKVCFAFHGNNQLTYRLFEGLSRRCLVVAQDLGSIRFADCGLRAGRHYVAVREDLSDLVRKTCYYLDHLDEAQDIADSGFSHFRANFQFSGVSLPQPLYRQITGSWESISIPQGRKTPYTLITRMLLPLIHSL